MTLNQLSSSDQRRRIYHETSFIASVAWDCSAYKSYPARSPRWIHLRAQELNNPFYYVHFLNDNSFFKGQRSQYDTFNLHCCIDLNFKNIYIYSSQGSCNWLKSTCSVVAKELLIRYQTIVTQGWIIKALLNNLEMNSAVVNKGHLKGMISCNGVLQYWYADCILASKSSTCQCKASEQPYRD